MIPRETRKMAFRGISRRRLASAVKPPGERTWTAAPAEPRRAPVPDSAANRAQRDERAVELRRSGLTYRGIAVALSISEATARRAVLGLDRSQLPRQNVRKDLPKAIKGLDGKTRRASWSPEIAPTVLEQGRIPKPEGDRVPRM